MMPEFVAPLIMAAIIGSTIIAVTFIRLYFRTKQTERSRDGADSLSARELEHLLESAVRRANQPLASRIERLEAKVAGTRKLKASDTVLLEEWDEEEEHEDLQLPGRQRLT